VCVGGRGVTGHSVRGYLAAICVHVDMQSGCIRGEISSYVWATTIDESMHIDVHRCPTSRRRRMPPTR
jgi:hypothetical protein